MVGIDLTKISRFKDKDQNFIQRILSEQEIEEYYNCENKEHFLATRWAIKEAIFKANNSYYQFNKINLKCLNRKYSFLNFEISTSSEDEYIIAIAIERKENNEY